MKTIVIILLIIFGSNIYAKTDNEVTIQSLKTYLALKKNKDVLTLLLYKAVGSMYTDGELIKKLELYFKLEIAGEIYFRKMPMEMKFKNESTIKPLPIILVAFGAFAFGWAISK